MRVDVAYDALRARVEGDYTASLKRSKVRSIQYPTHSLLIFPVSSALSTEDLKMMHLVPKSDVSTVSNKTLQYTTRYKNGMWGQVDVKRGVPGFQTTVHHRRGRLVSRHDYDDVHRGHHEHANANANTEAFDTQMAKRFSKYVGSLRVFVSL